MIHKHTHARIHTYTHLLRCRCQEQLIAELLSNPVPAPPEPSVTADVEAVAVPPHIVDGTEITIHDLMVGDEHSLKDKDLVEWLDAREELGFAKMAESQATGAVTVDHSTIRTLARKYTSDSSNLKCRGNALTRSCAFTGSFVILEDGRRVLYPECPGN